ncbi:MAG: hydantoinase/oxoprolinase family protein [bacterium]|nr:hydantoinase/oxoprolinase family protein [bacterium]
MADLSDKLTLAIDIGGTFTDLVMLDSVSQALTVSKVLTTYPDPAQGVLDGVRALFDTSEVDPGRVGRMIHGTTLVTNTLIERKGARTGLITTEGFRDALEIGREGRYDIYDLFLQLPEPLVERRLRLEVPERLYARGEVLTELDEDRLRQACEALKQEGVEAVGISFLHAYMNPIHEQKARKIVQEMMPDVALSVSHEVAAELREYERTSTTVANAYVQPLVERYLKSLEAGIRQLGLSAPLHIMLSNGGTCSVETASRFPVRLVESGPCGGALAGAFAGEQAGCDNVLAFDMGGTTAKAILSVDGEFPVTTESEVARVYRFKRGSGLPLLVPVLDLIEIGAGGGSLARVSELGLPTVGPESAGSNPGPACYGLGGQVPTVTDADLILGYLNPDYFLGGTMALDVLAARTALGKLGDVIQMQVEQTAWGIHRLVNENMANAARVHSAERGLDLREYTLVATGGAGPVHACGVAERLGIEQVVVPPIAGVASAFGLMLAPISFDFSRSYVARLADLNWARLNELFSDMEQAGKEVVGKAGVLEEEIQVSRVADMRYVGQGHEIRVPIPSGDFGEAFQDDLQEAFDAAYRGLYGRVCEGVPVEAIHWRVTVCGPKAGPGEIAREVKTGQAFKGRRMAIFEAGALEVDVFDRYRLASGFEIDGPVILEEAESTTVVPIAWRAAVDEPGNLVLVRSGGGR